MIKSIEPSTEKPKKAVAEGDGSSWQRDIRLGRTAKIAKVQDITMFLGRGLTTKMLRVVLENSIRCDNAPFVTLISRLERGPSG